MNDEITPRDIDTLLALTTYQGMTDEEINLVIQYMINRATASLVSQANVAYDEGVSSAQVAHEKELVDYTKNLLDTLCAQPVFLEVVDNG